jgi:hypothetical protein
MKHEKKFRQEEQVSATQTQSQSQANATIREFATPEEMLRFDAKQTVVPRRVVQRLSESLQNEPRAPGSWWKRFFGGNS